jgi:hypothetical protein
MSDYDFLDDHDDFIEQHAHHEAKVFDHPLDNDPLSKVEDSITPTEPLPSPLTTGTVTSDGRWIDSPKQPLDGRGAPLVPRESFRSEWLPHQTKDAPGGYNWRSERIYWREPPVPRLKGSNPQLKSSKGGGDSKTKCPLTDKFVSHSKCNVCEYFDSKDSIHACKLKRAEADRLSGKK